MRLRNYIAATAFLLGIGATAFLAADIPFLWLDAPTSRSNPNDPKSPLWVPTATLVPVSSGPASTSTSTSTPTPPNTATATSTISPSPTLTSTPYWDGADPGDNTFSGSPNMPPAVNTTFQTTSAHEVGDSGDGADYFSLNLTNGQQYSFTLTMSLGTASVELRNAADGTVVAAGVAISSYTLLAGTGTYYVVVRSTSGGRSTYQLNYQDVSGATATSTPMNTSSNTPSATASATPSVTPLANTATNTVTPSNTQSITQTWTYSMTATPTATISGPDLNMVYDGEDLPNDGMCLNDFGALGGGLWTGSSGSSAPYGPPFDSWINPDGWPWGSSTAGGAYGTSAYAACIDGQIGQQQSPWPWIAFQMGLGTPYMDINPYSANKGLRFDYKATVANVDYAVRIQTQVVVGLADYAHFRYVFRPTDTAWHTLTVYFPGYGQGSPEFARPSWASCATWDATQAIAVDFIPMGDGAAATMYGICVDNVTFSAAPPVAPSNVVALFEDYESGALTSPGGWDDGSGISTATTSISTTSPQAGVYCEDIAVNCPNDNPAGDCPGCWGAAVSLRSPAGVINATGATHLSFWIRAAASTPANIQLQITEEGVPAPDPNNEEFTYSLGVLCLGTAWQNVIVPLSSFNTESPYNAQCNASPDCASTGNNTLDLGGIVQLALQFGSNDTTTNIYIDNIQFMN